MSKQESEVNVPKALLVMLIGLTAVMCCMALHTIVAFSERQDITDAYLCKIGEIDHDWGEWHGGILAVSRTCTRCNKLDRYVSEATHKKYVDLFHDQLGTIERLINKVKRLECENERDNESPYWIAPSNGLYDITITNTDVSGSFIVLTNTCTLGGIILDGDVTGNGSIILNGSVTAKKFIVEGKRWWQVWK